MLAPLCAFFVLQSGVAADVNNCDVFCLFQQEMTRGIPKTAKVAPLSRKDIEPSAGVVLTKIPKMPLKKSAVKPTTTQVPPPPPAQPLAAGSTQVPPAKPFPVLWPPFSPSQPSAARAPTNITQVPRANPLPNLRPPFFGSRWPMSSADDRSPMSSAEPFSTLQPDVTSAKPSPAAQAPEAVEPGPMEGHTFLPDPVVKKTDETLYNVSTWELELSNMKLAMKEMDEKMASMSASMKRTRLQNEFMSSEIWFASHNPWLLEQAEQRQLDNQEDETTASYRLLKNNMKQLQDKLGSLTKEISERQIAYEKMTRELKQIQYEHAEISKQLVTEAAEN